MNIALISNDAKKELFVQFCTAYSGVFAKHKLFATANTGRMLADQAGLQVQLLDSGIDGVEQMAAMISIDEIDLLLLFRDGKQEDKQDEENSLLRVCDVHNLPAATNIATAEALVHALERGDLDWLEIQRQNRQPLDW